MRHRPEDDAVDLGYAIHHCTRQGRALRTQARKPDVARFERDPEAGKPIGGREHTQRCLRNLRPDAVTRKNE
jgi:hypothetical protein